MPKAKSLDNPKDFQFYGGKIFVIKRDSKLLELFRRLMETQAEMTLHYNDWLEYSDLLKGKESQSGKEPQIGATRNGLAASWPG